jgi:hypothetical protein
VDVIFSSKAVIHHPLVIPTNIIHVNYVDNVIEVNTNPGEVSTSITKIMMDDEADKTFSFSSIPIKRAEITAPEKGVILMNKENIKNPIKYKVMGEELLGVIKKRRVSTANDTRHPSTTSAFTSSPFPHTQQTSVSANHKPKIMFVNTHGVSFSSQLKAAVNLRRNKLDDPGTNSGFGGIRQMTDPDGIGKGSIPSKSIGIMKAIDSRRNSVRQSISREEKQIMSSKPTGRRMSLNSCLLQVTITSTTICIIQH